MTFLSYCRLTSQLYSKTSGFLFLFSSLFVHFPHFTLLLFGPVWGALGGGGVTAFWGSHSGASILIHIEGGVYVGLLVGYMCGVSGDA